jgi:hypothetical protein
MAANLELTDRTPVFFRGREHGSFPNADSAMKVLFLDHVPGRGEPPEPDRKYQQLDYHLQRTHLAYGDRLGTDWARR